MIGWYEYRTTAIGCVFKLEQIVGALWLGKNPYENNSIGFHPLCVIGYFKILKVKIRTSHLSTMLPV